MIVPNYYKQHVLCIEQQHKKDPKTKISAQLTTAAFLGDVKKREPRKT